MKSRHALTFLSILAAGLASPPAACAADPPFAVEATQQATEWTISHQGRKLMVYAFAPNTFKPYVKALYTTKGYNVLRDSPADHLHHHALMYGIRVNEVNFWEETAGCGVQKPVQTAKPELGMTATGRPQVRLRQIIHWVMAEDAFLPDTSRVALLVEERTLTLSLDAAAEEVALEWRSAFQAGPKTNQVSLTGATYHGLGMRFQTELDPLAAHLNAGGKPDLSNGRQDITPHAWGSVTFDLPGKPATVVLYGHPANARGNATFFTMRTPFAYVSATQGLDKEPLVYARGDKFAVDYLVLLSARRLPAETIEQRGKAWRAVIDGY